MLLFSIIVFLAMHEFYGLIEKHDKNISINKWINYFGGIYLFISLYIYASGLYNSRILLAYILIIITLFIIELYRKRSQPILNLAYSLFGQIYCALPMGMLNLIAFDYNNGLREYKPWLLLSLFIFVWANDTGAFCVGSLFGKHRLFERISPKKSWEGFWGGFFFTLLASQIIAYFEPCATRYEWLGLAAVVVVFATWGDLTESLLKRTLGVKDSGNLLPGHGGVLDRFDSVLMAAPAAYIFIEFFIRN